MCIVLMCSLRSQFQTIGLQTDRQAGREGVNATVLFLLHCFANNFGVAMGFSFSQCQAAQTLIRLPEHTLIHSAECMVRQTGRQLARTQGIQRRHFKSVGVMYQLRNAGVTLNHESSLFTVFDTGLLLTLSITSSRDQSHGILIQKALMLFNPSL